MRMPRLKNARRMAGSALPHVFKEYRKADTTIETISSLERLNDLHEAWNRLAERFRTPLLSHEWFSSCAAAFCPPGRLHVLVLRSNGDVRAIAPMVRVNRLGIDYLEMLGAGCLMEPTALLFEDAASCERLVDALFDLGSPLFLMRMLSDPDMEAAVRAAAEKKSFLVVENANASPWLPIASSWDQFEKRMTRHWRHSLRRRRRRLEEVGRVALEIHTQASDDFARALDEAFRIEASGWKAKQGTAILLNEKLKTFLTAYIATAARSGIVRLFLLKVDGKGIAMVLGVEHARQLWILKSGYDESWARFGPGIILQNEAIRWAFERQLEGYEFLGAMEAWEQTWTEASHTYRTYRLFPRSVKGFLALGTEGGRIARRHAAGSVAKRVSVLRNADRKWRTGLTRARDRMWEWTLGVHTRGLVHVGVEGAARTVTLPYGNIMQILRAVGLNPTDVFVDIGCGTGRVLCCAARFRVREVIGIEYAPEICELAQQNAARLRGRQSPIRLLNQNAAAYDYDGGTVFYLYNPVDAVTLNRVLEKIRTSLERQKRPITVIYALPVHESCLAACSWLEMADRWEAGGNRHLAVPVSFWRTKA
jgi:CelD/BcsL family acetyltransferase involved in cellulose biosynthesis